MPFKLQYIPHPTPIFYIIKKNQSFIIFYTRLILTGLVGGLLNNFQSMTVVAKESEYHVIK